MSAVATPLNKTVRDFIHPSAHQRVPVLLVGTGTVATAVYQRLQAWKAKGFASHLDLRGVVNSRGFVQTDAQLSQHQWDALANTEKTSDTAGSHIALAVQTIRPQIIIDATASTAIAQLHADWLRQRVNVITACKLARGSEWDEWNAIELARETGSFYGDSATVGAGLPLLQSIRALRAGGDSIHAIAGVLSGSLAWLFHHYDGMRPFSNFVRQARDAGYTEPDPREDLSGEDVRRKILILARAAGADLAPDDVRVQSLLPQQLIEAGTAEVDALLPSLDTVMREHYSSAYKENKRLAFIARWNGNSASVGLEMLSVDDPLAAGSATDNRVAIWSDRYRAQPLVIQGPGAGAEVTAAALLDDALEAALAFA